ncbi:MAG: SPOR domain-containing protein [Bacteroidales bacterium]|nr:SPOR domain-containing protein [Bacteroidales bacterium]
MNKVIVSFCAIALTFSACKSSKPSSLPVPPSPVVVGEAPAAKPVSAVNATSSDTKVVSRSEEVSMAPGESGAIQRYNVIIGSFQNYNNAQALKAKMINRNYNVKLLQNPQGMYRVCVFSSNDENESRNQIRQIHTNYPDEFQDAWLLIAR